MVYNCSKDHPDKESFGFPCMWYPCIGYVGLSDMQPLEKEEPWKHSYELHPGKTEFQKADGPGLTTPFLLFDPGHIMTTLVCTNTVAPLYRGAGGQEG